MKDRLVKKGIIVESVTGQILDPEQIEVQEKEGGKKVMRPRIRLITAGVTLNDTVYTFESFKGGVKDKQDNPSGYESATNPYNKHMIQEHDLNGDSFGVIKEAFLVDEEDVKAIDIVPEIVDEKAQEKIQDGRFNTVSAGIRTNHAYCTACLAEGKSKEEADQVKQWCDHNKGEEYTIKKEDGTEEKVTARWQIGDIWIREASFVKNPAATGTGVLDQGEKEENNKPKDETTDKPTETPGKPEEKDELAEKLESLDKSAFCGPNKSFPVSDFAEVTAARRLIGRAKVSAATKKAVLAKVTKKEKDLGEKEGYTSEALDNAMELIESTIPSLEQWEEDQKKETVNEKEELKAALEIADGVMSTFDDESNQDLKGAFDQVLEIVKKQVQVKEEQEIQDKVAEANERAEAAEETAQLYKKELKEAKDKLTEADSKVEDLKERLESSESKNKELAASLHESYVEHAADLSIGVKIDKDKRDDAIESLSDRTSNDLKEMIKKATEVEAKPPVEGEEAETDGETHEEAASAAMTEGEEVNAVASIVDMIKKRREG